jgi:hypothetical protein
MQHELAQSGLSHEEILAKTMLLQKALTGDNSAAFINKNLQNALDAANVSPQELAKVSHVSCKDTITILYLRAFILLVQSNSMHHVLLSV